MNPALKSMLDRYSCKTANDFKNALKEIIQETALLGLWRSKFFEHAAFYGDTSLRILYGLDRFSEDLDFSLLKSDPNLNLKKYYAAVQAELQSFGLKVTVEEKEKSESREPGNEVLPFIRDPESVALWSKDFFYEIATKIKLDH